MREHEACFAFFVIDLFNFDNAEFGAHELRSGDPNDEPNDIWDLSGSRPSRDHKANQCSGLYQVAGDDRRIIGNLPTDDLSDLDHFVIDNFGEWLEACAVKNVERISTR